MKKLVIQLWQTNFKSIELAATPFLMATTAAAMDLDVEIHATGFCVAFFMKDQPHLDQLVASSNRPLRDYVDEAISCGVKVCLCSMALRDRDITPPLLREGVEIVGLVTMLDRATDPETTVLVY
jgi:predicted peroxiredoxin